MIKKIAKSIREYKRDSLLTPLLVIVEIICEVLIPTLMAQLVDQGINAGNLNVIVKMGAVMIVIAVISLFAGGYAGKTCAVASAGFAKNLRHDMYVKVQQFSFKNIDKFSVAGIVTRLTTDVMNIQQAYMMLIRTAIRSPLMLIFSFVFAIRLNARLSLIFVVSIPIITVAAIILLHFVQPYFKKVFDTYDVLNNVVEEDIRGIRVVKSYNREDFETEKFNKISKKIYDLFVRAERLMTASSPLMQVVIYATILCISWFGAKMIVNSGSTTFTTGELMSMFTYSQQILMSFMMLAMIVVQLTMSKASGDRICEILDEVPDIQNPENPIEKVNDGSIEFDNVSFKYSAESEKNCLDKITIKINSGETIGIIGGTGSSKSTFVSLIPRLYDCDEGVVKVGGVDVKSYDLEALRNDVACVLQKNELFTGTIKDNLRWGKEDATDEEIERACCLSQADEFIQKMPGKYNTMIDQGGANVSGGQKQRLCIARALIKKPKIIILDDSTSAVDTKTDKLIQDAFKSEIPDTTKLIIAQRISSVEGADRIIVLDDGKINDVGTHEELLGRCKIYQEVYESQTKSGSDFDMKKGGNQ